MYNHTIIGHYGTTATLNLDVQWTSRQMRDKSYNPGAWFPASEIFDRIRASKIKIAWVEISDDTKTIVLYPNNFQHFFILNQVRAMHGA